jgi:hypothetical protein
MKAKGRFWRLPDGLPRFYAVMRANLRTRIGGEA